MTALERFYASDGPDLPIATIEITRPSRPDPILICQGYDDITCMTEDGRLLTFIAGAIDVSIPKRDNSGNQNVGFAIDNVTGFAQQYISEAIDAGEPVTLILRIYLESDLTAPAERPIGCG
ncbi:ArsR family transcriptional regulator [Pseudomonas aeruginosa]|nr:ArsR family transcriptional regulator [Pseudomonas aeruginosa]